MRLVALAQKFDVVSESHQFSYRFPILSRDMSHNACRQTYVLDSNWPLSSQSIQSQAILVIQLGKPVSHRSGLF